jgi:hypothetical protein
MSCRVNATMRIERVFRWRENCVKFRFADVGIEAIDLSERGVAVNREAIRAKPNKFAYICSQSEAYSERS